VRRLHLKRQTKTFDKRLFLLSLLLTAIGLVAIADASAPLAVKEFSDRYYFFKQQLVWALLGFFLMILFANIKYTFWRKLSTPFFIFSVLSLIIVLIPGIGESYLGARRWIVFGDITVQPSEMVKFSLCLYFAALSCTNAKVNSFLIPIFLIGFLIMLEPDLGTTLVILAIGLSQVFISGIGLVPFFILIITMSFLSLILTLTSDYRRERLMTFIKQTQDPLGKEYHIRQILLALGSGGAFGVGLGKSRQKYLFLPETATDSIFPIIAEEVGFIGASLIIFLFFLYFFRIIKIASHAPDTFSKIFTIGFAAWLGGQTFLNIGSMLAVVPLTGIPLPFISYGGSSLISILAASGIVLNISRHVKA